MPLTVFSDAGIMKKGTPAAPHLMTWETSGAVKGKVEQIIGAVVDVRFDDVEQVPDILNCT